MRRPSPVRQQGFGLLAFVMAAAVVAFSLVIGYSGLMVRQHHNDLQERNEALLAEYERGVRELWREKAHLIDQASETESNNYTAEDILSAAGVSLRGLAEAHLSDVFKEGDFSYRVMVIFFPTDTDDRNPPDIAEFKKTGKFQSCKNPQEVCAQRQFVVISSYDMQKELIREAQARLNRVAYRAQAHFKARMLLEPEKSITVNYFRKPFGECVTVEADLDCLDTYTPLLSISPAGAEMLHAAKALQLTDEELVSPWGQPIEASNLLDSETESPPYTMAFRVLKPSGGYLVTKAVQPL